MRQLNGQRKQLLEALRAGSMTTGEIRSKLGIGMPATRVHELKEMGYDIRTNMVDVPSRFGHKTKVAKYTLVESVPERMAA